MIRTVEEVAEHIIILNEVTNIMAEQIKVIRLMMVGRGISPADAGLVGSRLNEIEAKLRMIGSNPDNLIPFAE